MSMMHGGSDLVATADGARAHNRKVVERYMASRGEERLVRHLLFAEDGIGGLWTTDSGQPIIIRGQEALRKHGIWSLQCFPDWSWTNVMVFDTQDPDWFWVECDGEGAIKLPGYPEGTYRNHFLHSFRFQDGKIKEQREFMNPCQQLRALGLSVPEVRRQGLPA